jgi:hypothetical protein
MLGAYSETSLAGVAAVNQIQFIYQQIMTAIGEGIVILGTQYFGQKQIGKYSVGIARLFVLVVLGFALDPGCFAAFMSIGIRENKPSVQADLGIQPAVSMRRILKVVFLKQQDIADEGSCPFRRVRETLFPAVKAAALDAHGFTEQFYRELSRQLHDYLVFLLPYRTTVPSPFTSYPFFSLASVIRALMSS